MWLITRGAFAVIILAFTVSCASANTPIAAPTLSSEPTRAVTTLPTSTVLPLPTSTAIPTPGVRAFRLIAYLASWSTTPSRGFRVADVPADKLTHLNYAFMTVSTDGACVSGDASADSRNFPELQKLKPRYPHLKTFISIGGAGAKNFPGAAKTAETRQKFAQSCIAFMRQNGFDGIDIDWEFPANAEEKQNYVLLLSELRAQLDTLGAASGTRYLLTVAAPAGPTQYVGVTWDAIARDLDWINLMTYDFGGPWSPVTNFNAPLYSSSSDPSIKAILYSGHVATQAYILAGVPPNKIVFGVPFYGRGWKSVPDVNRGLYQKFDGVPQGTRGGGAFDYRDIKQNYLPMYTRYWHDEAKVPWLYNPATGIMISYDDPESLAIKTEYVKTNKLGGVMIWEISTDDEQHSLINAIYTRLH